ncbi:hypothetical protein TorRG33x02_034650 [Trema orientale]|uniref:Uncharacterized protein n=1 Tax=Trema orientale TaxID=63057 RepID=A0A2P5FST4_TREOI|nr:hypothetical protein TorRG33x02_034650 [Trema orientale]
MTMMTMTMTTTTTTTTAELQRSIWFPLDFIVVSLVNSATDGLTAMDLIAGHIKSIMSISGCGTCSFIPSQE